MTRQRVIHRSSITGRIVSEQFARDNPNTTTRETVRDDIECGSIFQTRAGHTAKVLHVFRDESGRNDERRIIALQHPGMLRKERITYHGLDGKCAPGSGVDEGDDLVAPLSVT